MDAKDSFVFFLLLLLSLGLFGSLSLNYCLWNKQTEVASELQNELHSKLQSELADMQTELRSKLQSELRNELVDMFQVALNGKVHLGTSDPSQGKGQLKRNVRQAEDTDTSGTLANVLTEVNRMKLLLKPYMNCSTNEYNYTKCTLKPGLKGEPGPGGEKGEPGDMGQRGESGSKGMKGNPGSKGEEGKEGLEGSQGPTGPPGPPGSRGIQGKDGVKGERGLVGPKGNTGPEGSQGPTGERGQKGDMGERGPKGDMGPRGPQGETGEMGGVGQKGEPGEKGMKGDQGYNGTKGEQGVAGPPAPTIAPIIAPTTPPTTTLTFAPTTAPPPATPGQCGGPEWRKVVFLDMTNTSHDCPTGLRLTTYSRRTCGRASTDYYSCSSTTFSVDGSEYSRVCGRALAYRFGYNDAFRAYHHLRRDINDIYVDGLALTHGASGSRQHIWTFASGLYTGSRHKSSRARSRCPCDNGNTFPSPPFVGNDYFCESTQTESTWGRRHFFPNAVLWDGQVCEGGGTCCRFNNPPWFTKSLANSTTEDIELRLCLLERGSNSGIALEQLELYIQ